jgi:hypothetical protein
MNIEDAWDLIEQLNGDAHDEAWDTWARADALEDSEDEDDWAEAEEVREQASLEQAEYFRDFWYDLSEDEQDLIKHFLKENADFNEQFMVYFGEEEFANEFPEFSSYGAE